MQTHGRGSDAPPGRRLGSRAGHGGELAARPPTCSRAERTLLPARPPQPFTCHLRSLSDPPRARLFHQAGVAASPQAASLFPNKLFFTRGSRPAAVSTRPARALLSAPGRTQPSTEKWALQPVLPSACSSTPSPGILVLSSSPRVSVSSSEKTG